MPHYDGPAFNREPHTTEPAYPLPKYKPRQPKPRADQPGKMAAAAAKPALEDAGRHSIDPLAALIAVPKHRPHPKKVVVDYGAIVTAMRPDPAAVYLFTTAADDEAEALTATATVEAPGAQTVGDDQQVDTVAPAPADPTPVAATATPDFEPMPADAASVAAVGASDAEDAADEEAPADAAVEDHEQIVENADDDVAAETEATAAVTETAEGSSPSEPENVGANDEPDIAETDTGAAVTAEPDEPAETAETVDVAASRDDEALDDVITTPIVEADAAATGDDPTAAADGAPIAGEAKVSETAEEAPVAATVSELIATGQPLPAEPTLKSEQKKAKTPAARPSKLPNPYAVRDSVREYLKAKRAAKKAAVGVTPPSPQPTIAQSAPAAPSREPMTGPSAAIAEPAPTDTLTPHAPGNTDDVGAGAGEGAATPAALRVAEPTPPDVVPALAVSASEPEALPASKPAATTAPEAPYAMPPLSLLAPPVVQDHDALEGWVADKAAQLDETLAAFHVEAHTVAHTVGPTVTQFQVALEPGVKVNKITNLTDDLKLALAAKDIRIEAPIPGKSTVGIEIPNLHPRPVMLREVLGSPVFQDAKSPLTVALGVDLFGQPQVTTLDKMPHGLIAGATGSGKSVFINSLLTSLLYKATPQQVRLLLIDPKAVELAVYNGLPHLVSPVVSDPKAASAALKWAVDEMEERYQKLAAAGARNLKQFNEMAEAHGDYGLVMPHIVIIVDELADLMMVAATEFQDYIARITAKARAAGIHLIVATQRPSVDVITGTIKNNIPTRIAFMVASQVDSRTIIDHNGAERLLGKGDMLYLGNGASQPIRLQGTFVDREIESIVDFVKQQRAPQYLFQPDKLVAHANAVEAQDALFPDVLKYLVGEKNVSTSKLQRVFSIGYNRAANLIDELEMRHYISPANGSKPRDVYFNKEDLPKPIDQTAH
ncbi:DNA translocase FtsK [Lacticaseibacillus kribbianus]|uniref:DNA translocase FtsK n=1 Tax=Lacticaseibacillus kribbianus TaxID=2926292 RepID=UPI001CD64C06|nr:DNA translocase FtsK [Lacticaseibacillus kribbianus]